MTSSILPTYTVARSDPRISEGLPTTTGTRGAAGIGDPYYPEMGNAGYDVLHYDLDLKVDLAVEEISAVATIQARSLQILERFNLDLREFDSISVKVNGEDAAYTQAEAELTITPAAGIPDGSDFTVEVVYHGRPSEGTAFGNIDFLEGWNFYPGGVIVAGEPTGAETWFPSNNHPLDKATYAFHITVARPLIAAANGVLKERTDNGDGTWTYEWAMDDPMASYLATVAVSNFDLLEGKTGNGVPYRNYLDADIRKDVEDSVVVLPSAVDFFSSVFGPYPFDVCGLVVHQVEIPFSLETQTLIVMGHTFVNEIVVVHELAHQWFGDSVSVASWKDIWLNEGFASYAEGLWWEHTQGKGALQEDITRRYNFSSSLPDSETILIGDPGPERLIDRQVYNRGALTLHALRVKVGDDAFFRILRAYYDRFRDRNAATSDFIALAEELSGRDLRDFFQAWLYKSTLPDISELGFSR